MTELVTPSRMPNVLLVGDIGTGKTHAIRTLLDAGMEVFVLKTEPSEVLDDTPSSKLHWRYIPAATVGWSTMLDHAQKINALSFKALAGVDDISKSKHTQFIEVIKACNNFVDDRTGVAYGDIMSWGHDRAFVIDSLSGLSWMSKALMCGSKPAPDRGEWGVAMDNIERFLNDLVTGTNCLFVLTAHLEREPNSLTGGDALYVSTLGQKLGPKIPRFFSDVIHTKRQGAKFVWSTITDNMALKARNLPWANDQAPNFVPLIQTWKARLAKAASST
jgi:AAA domain-containing protein